MNKKKLIALKHALNYYLDYEHEDLLKYPQDVRTVKNHIFYSLRTLSEYYDKERAKNKKKRR